jgi:hypothetical protein
MTLPLTPEFGTTARDPKRDCFVGNQVFDYVRQRYGATQWVAWDVNDVLRNTTLATGLSAESELTQCVRRGAIERHPFEPYVRITKKGQEAS